MRNLRLISTTAAILLLGAGVVSAQGTKSDGMLGAPAAQQNAPTEKVSPSVKSDRSKAPEKAGTATESDRQQITDKGGAATKASSDGSADETSRHMARHRGADYASGHHRSLYNHYRGDRGCWGHRHSWTPWLGC